MYLKKTLEAFSLILFLFAGSIGCQRPTPTPVPQPSAPAGATARCRDGTYSYSKHRQGTCSHHGGVAEWL